MTQALNLANFANFINSSGQANSTTALSGATTGYVPFGASNGSLQYNSNLYFDGTKLGIGTASPLSGYNLTVANGIAIQNSYPSQFAFVKASYFGYSPSSYQAAVLGTTSGNQTICVGVDPSSISGGSFNGSGAELLVSCLLYTSPSPRD